MDTKDPDNQRVDVNFESHPPIPEDLDGISNLLRQTFLHLTDCNSLARHLIHLKDITQVIALEEPDEENTTEEDEPDDDIYGVTSFIDLQGSHESGDSQEKEARRQLLKYLKDKCPALSKLCDEKEIETKLGLVVNERYINLPPQLALPTLKNLTKSLSEYQFSHLIFVSKILLRARNTDTKLPSKKVKSDQSSSTEAKAEPIIFVNPEEEIIFENAQFHSDVDISSQCDENATWSLSTDVKYIPHRRIIVLDSKKWNDIMSSLEKELI